MKFELLAVFNALIIAVTNILYKKFDINVLIQSILISIVLFIGNAYKNPRAINKIMTTDALKIGLSGVIMFVLNLTMIKRLPLSFVAPLSTLWMFFSLGFAKYMLDIDITKNKVIGMIIVSIGIILMQFHHIFGKTIKFTPDLIYLIVLFIGSLVCKAYQTTVIKKLTKHHSESDLLVMDFGMNFLLLLVIFVIYLLNPFGKWASPKMPSIKLALTVMVVFGLINFVRSTLRFEIIDNLPENTYVVLTNMQLIFTIIIAYFIYKEPLHKKQFVGTFMILLGIYVSQHKHIPHPHLET